jgi:glycosyltransferase involved in cell wall biosynthesis
MTARPLRLLVPLDRLDGRRHTFGTYLTGWLRAMAPSLDDLVLLRKRDRSYPSLDDLPQATIPPWLEGNRAYSLLFPLWARRFGATLVHFPHRFAPYTWWGLEAMKVVTVHDTALITLSGDLVSRMRPRTVWRYRRALAGFDAVVTVSEASREELAANFALPPSRIRVIHHGVDPRFSPGLPRRDLSRYGVSSPFILNVSSLKRKKNVEGLVHAFARLVQEGYPHRLVLVGKPDDGLPGIERAIATHRLQTRVVLTGFVDEADHPDFYRQADLLVYPSFYEGFGLPVVEAMACGCPVVTSCVSSLPEAAGGAAILVPPDDVAALTGAMRRVLDDPVLGRELVARGLERASRLTWEAAARTHLDLYRTLLDGGPPP